MIECSLLYCKYSGYVSEIRKKNWKICWPFALDGDLDKSDQEKSAMLPPLNAPKFRSWCCQNCLREIGSKNVAKSTDLIRHVGSDSKCTGFRMPPITATALLQSDCQQGPKSKIVEEKRFHAYTHSANENSLANSMSHKMPRFSSAEREVNTNRMQERHNHVTGDLLYFLLFILYYL